MIEVYVPFLLLLLSWQPDDPQGSMEVSQRVFLGARECEAAGTEIEKRRDAEPDDDKEFVWRCVPQQRDIELYQPLTDSK